MIERYLSVDDGAREALAALGLDVTYGALLADGSTLGKVWVEELPELPEGVEDLGTDAEVVLELLAPAPEDWP